MNGSVEALTFSGDGSKMYSFGGVYTLHDCYNAYCVWVHFVSMFFRVSVQVVLISYWIYREHSVGKSSGNGILSVLLQMTARFTSGI
jgi:hypothetical protein